MRATTHETFVPRVARTRLNLSLQTFVSSFRPTDTNRMEQRGDEIGYAYIRARVR